MPKAKFLELDSDPGTFSLILQDLGLSNLLVEEIYDIDAELSGNDILGFIFLFKWGDYCKLSGQARRKAIAMEQELESKYIYKDQNGNLSPFDDLVFARQRATNSCATHALLSILLNLPEQNINKSTLLLSIKHELDRLKTQERSNGNTFLTKSEQNILANKRGKTLGGNEILQTIHNKYAGGGMDFEEEVLDECSGVEDTVREQTILERLEESNFEQKRIKNEGSDGSKFHFTSYIPYSNHIIELDGLRPAAILHDKYISAKENWLKSTQKLIKSRIQFISDLENTNDIRYSLLALQRSPLSDYNRNIIDTKNQLWSICEQITTLLATKKSNNASLKDIRLKVETVKNEYFSERNTEKHHQRRSKRKNKKDNLQPLYKLFKVKLVEVKSLEKLILNLHDKFQRYQIEHQRRTHNYTAFIEATIQHLHAANLIPYNDPNNN